MRRKFPAQMWETKRSNRSMGIESTSNAVQHSRQMTSNRSGGENVPNTADTGCGQRTTMRPRQATGETKRNQLHPWQSPKEERG